MLTSAGLHILVTSSLLVSLHGQNMCEALLDTVGLAEKFQKNKKTVCLPISSSMRLKQVFLSFPLTIRAS